MSRETEFTDLSIIGRGGYSTVYKCRNKLDQQWYALKKITLKISKGDKNWFLAHNKVFEEAKSLSRLSHENIIRYYSSWVHVVQEGHNCQPKAMLNSGKKNSFFSREQETVLGLKADFKSSSFEEREDRSTPDRSQPSGDGEDSFKTDKELKDCSLILFKPDSEDSADKRHDAQESPKPRSLKERRGLFLSDVVDTSEGTSMIPDRLEFFILTELCESTLRTYLDLRNVQVKKNPANLTWVRDAFDLAKQLVNGLIFLSSAQVIHRDIKPSNIFLTEDMKVKYGDFGLVKSCDDLADLSAFPTPTLSPMNSTIKQFGDSTLDASSHQPSTDRRRERRYSCIEDNINYDLTRKIGTTMYASPEQLNSSRYAKKTDYYSLGLVLIEVFVPLYTEMERYKVFEAIRKKGVFEREAFPGTPNKLRSLLNGLIRSEPSERIALDELLDCLKREELQLLKAVQEPYLSQVLVKVEGQSAWKEKSVAIVSNKLLVFDPSFPTKAESQYDLEDYLISRSTAAVALPPSDNSAQASHTSTVFDGHAAVELSSQHLLGVAVMHSAQPMTDMLFELLFQAKKNQHRLQCVS